MTVFQKLSITLTSPLYTKKFDLIFAVDTKVRPPTLLHTEEYIQKELVTRFTTNSASCLKQKI